MDHIRSCYKVRIRPYPDSPETTEITWYFAPIGAKVFPFYHVFGSANWATVKTGFTTPGEVSPYPRPYYDGASLSHATGQHYCGTIQDFQGLGSSLEPPLPVNELGEPICCVPSPGGIYLGGQATVWHHVAIRRGSGTIRLGGTAPVRVTANSKSRGHVVLSGRSPAIGRVSTVGSGVLRLLGSPRIAPTALAVGRGGVVVTGITPAPAVGFWTPEGELALGGHAKQAPKVTPKPSGDIALLGHALQDPVAPYLATGTIYEGGTAPYTFTTPCTGWTFCDLFHDANSTGLPSHTPNVAPAGGWSDFNGNFWIQSNQAQQNGTNVSQDVFAIADTTLSDGFLQSEIVVPGTASYAFGLVFRWQDSSNWWAFILNNYLGTSALYLQEAVGGSFFNRASYTAGFAAGSYRFEVTLSGSSIKCGWNGGVVITYTSSDFSTKTKCGLLSYNDGGTFAHLGLWNNFRMKP